MTNPLITLYVPGTRNDLIQKAAKYEPDAIIIDLEDTVPPAIKADARKQVSDVIPELDIPAIVRVNNEPEYLLHDLEAIASDKIVGLIIPKIESTESVQRIDQELQRIENERGLAARTVKLILQIESTLGVMRCYDLLTAASRIESLTFGSAEDGDLQRDLDCAYSVEGIELLYARSKVLLEGRAAKLPYVLDGVFSNIKDTEAFRQDCVLSRRLGYDGRTLIHPGQIAIAREAYRLSETAKLHYKNVIEEFEAAERRGEASIQVDGKLIDYAMYNQAKKALSRV